MISLPVTVSTALLVIAGAYGNGEERKEKLMKDGYEPIKIQSCVNELYPIIRKYGG